MLKNISINCYFIHARIDIFYDLRSNTIIFLYQFLPPGLLIKPVVAESPESSQFIAIIGFP